MALWSLQRGELPARSVGAAGPCSSSLDLLHLSASWLLFFVQSTVKRKKKKKPKNPKNILRVSANTNLIIPAQIQSDLIPSKGGARPPPTLCREEEEGGQAPGVPKPLCPWPSSVEVQASS